jgi:rhodanese-related sulfurtransferase
MKVAIISIVLILAFVGVALFTKHSGSQTASATATIQTVKADIARGGQLLDVRTPGEYGAGHIDGSINLSLQELQAGALPTATKDKPVYVYCHSGNRSSQAAAILKRAGYQNIIDLGPMSHVQSIGGTVKV